MLRELLQHAIRGLQPLLVLLRLVAFLRGGGGSALRRCRRACSRRGAAWRAWGAIRGRSPHGDAPPRCETAPPPCWAAPAWSRPSSRQPWRPLLPRAAQTAAKPRRNDAAARGALAARRPACSPALGAERARLAASRGVLHSQPSCLPAALVSEVCLGSDRHFLFRRLAFARRRRRRRQRHKAFRDHRRLAVIPHPSPHLPKQLRASQPLPPQHRWRLRRTRFLYAPAVLLTT